MVAGADDPAQALAERPQQLAKQTGLQIGEQVIDREHGRLRVYERGSGETLACGSGACAAAAVGRLWGLFGPQVALSLRGGELNLEWAGADAPVLMTGPAETVFTGEIEWQR